MSKWKRICAAFLLIVGLYKYCSLRSSYQEGRVGIPLTGLNPTLFFFYVCSKPGPGLLISYVVAPFCVVREVIVCFTDIIEIVVHHCFVS